MNDLSGKKVLAIVTNRGVEQDELKVPAERLTEAGAVVSIAAPKLDDVQTLVGDWDAGEIWPVGETLNNINPADYDLLLIPGGTLNADSLRLNEDAQRIVKAFASAGRPVAAICHGPWLLVETELVKGKTLTSYRSVKTDVVNAGGTWKDVEVFRCTANRWALITSRSPADLDPFIEAISEELVS